MKKIAIIGSGLLGCLTAFKTAKKFPKEIYREYRNEQYRMKKNKSACSFSTDYEELCKKCKCLIGMVKDKRYDIINDEIYDEICNKNK